MSAVVIGANGLIGNAISRALATQDVVWILARDRDALDKLAAENPAQLRPLQVDATDDSALKAAIEQAAGQSKLRIAVNNIGVAHRPSPLADLPLAEFDRVIATTLRAVAAAMKFELASMTRGAAIVNVASSAGLAGAPGMSAYVAAKHAVIGLTRTAAIDYGPSGIRINAVAPGPIESGPIMFQDPTVRHQVGSHLPLGRMGTANEVANAVLWLTSSESSYTTGTTLPIDGGKNA